MHLLLLSGIIVYSSILIAATGLPSYMMPHREVEDTNWELIKNIKRSKIENDS